MPDLSNIYQNNHNVGKRLGRLLVSLTVVNLLLSTYTFANDDGSVGSITDIAILANTQVGDCRYTDEVAIEVEYIVETLETAEIEVSGSEDGILYFPILSKVVEQGRGSSVLVFDVGECLMDISVELK